jgi:hypothetical protein
MELAGLWSINWALGKGYQLLRCGAGCRCPGHLRLQLTCAGTCADTALIFIRKTKLPWQAWRRGMTARSFASFWSRCVRGAREPNPAQRSHAHQLRRAAPRCPA